jgi:3-hydroxyacyl-CoA dehydrogenase/enoyl-CoA hydratase/3-hydroxybutyryl-CoA epimerase
MHFFSPVDRMPLVEVIGASASDKGAIATTVKFGQRLGKTVIVVADSPGFWVNRIFAPYGVEAGHLLMEGVPIEIIDEAMTRFGFPVGPITLSDEVGIDVAAKAGKVMREAFGDRLAPAPVIDAMVAAGRIGRKAKLGFYTYHDDKKGEPDPAVYPLLGITPQSDVDMAVVERRLLYPFLNEAARAFAEGVVRSARDGDIGAVFGLGYPPFRGGPLRTIDVIGASRLVDELKELADKHGPRFAPCEALVERAASGRPYFD